MISAARISNFIPQNPKLNAPRRINVELPEFQQTISAFNHGFPLPNAVNGGIKYQQTSLNPMANAGTLNMNDVMYPCIISPALGVNRVIAEPPIPDPNGYQAPYGYARGQPKGIASIKKRDALFAYKCPPIMSTNVQLAPKMSISPF